MNRNLRVWCEKWFKLLPVTPPFHPIGGPATPPLQLPANVKATADGPSAFTPSSMRDIQKNLLAPGFSLV